MFSSTRINDGVSNCWWRMNKMGELDEKEANFAGRDPGEVRPQHGRDSGEVRPQHGRQKKELLNRSIERKRKRESEMIYNKANTTIWARTKINYGRIIFSSPVLNEDQEERREKRKQEKVSLNVSIIYCYFSRNLFKCKVKLYSAVFELERHKRKKRLDLIWKKKKSFQFLRFFFFFFLS